MNHSNKGFFVALCAAPLRSIAALSILALAPACEPPAEHSGSPGAAVHAAAPLGVAAAQEAPAECGVPREDRGCEGGAMAAASTDGKVEQVNVDVSPARGPEDAPVTVVVFSDFQCPFCSKAERTLAQLDADYPGKLRFVFKNNPLPFHNNAKLAAKAALAAGEQGKYWEYHDALFADGSELDAESLGRHAEDLGLDIAKFRRAMASKALDAAIDADIAEAKRLDVKGTPTFFINGRRIIGAQPLSVLRAAIDLPLGG